MTGVKAVQLHGDETLADFEFLECPLLKSATLGDLVETLARMAGGDDVAARRGRSRAAWRHRAVPSTGIAPPWRRGITKSCSPAA